MKKATNDKFKLATADYIREMWIKRKHPLLKRKPDYPVRVTDFIRLVVGGKIRLFRVQIEEFKKPKDLWAKINQ